MRLVLLNIFPTGSMARYLLSSYVLKAYLAHNSDLDLEIQVLNFSDKAPSDRIVEKLLDYEPDAIGYSCYTWNIEQVISVIQMLQKNTMPLQILGGPEIAGSKLEELARRELGDYYVVGEGERKLEALLQFLANKGLKTTEPPPDGLAARRGRDLVYIPKEMSVDLTSVPSVYLTNTLDDRLYARQQAYLETQRGCRYKCAYCVYHKGLQGIGYYPIERIITEIDHLVIDKRITALRIFDAIFTSNLERAKAIVQHLVELKGRIEHRLPWIYWEFVYSKIDPEFLELTGALKYRDRIHNCDGAKPKDRPQVYSDLLKDYTVVNCIGVQSLNRESLKAVKRAPIDLMRFDSFMETVRKANVVLKVDLILGLPHETRKTFFHGLEYLLQRLKEADHILNIHRLQILPGSTLEQTANNMGFEYTDEAPHIVYSTPDINSADMARLSKLCGLVFRIVNSPLRSLFYESLQASGLSLEAFFEYLLEQVLSDDATSKTRLATEHEVDDVYWNDDLFRELPSAWIADQLRFFL